MGIKRKIQLGFIMIGVLLFLSGLISSMELMRLNRKTAQLLEWSRHTIELTKNMLDLAQEQNTALMISVADSTKSFDSIVTSANRRFELMINEAHSYTDSIEIAKIVTAYQRYNNVASQIPDNLTIHWFSNIYHTSYYELTYEIKEFMMMTQNHIINFTGELESNAYRASMVGIIALGAGIFLIFLFHYMINHFFINPILRMNKGLRNHLTSNLPFDVQIATEDEMLELRDYIAQLIASLKKQNKE